MSDRADDMMASYKTGQLWERGEIVKWLRHEVAALRFAGEEEPWEVCEALADAIERAEHER